MKDKNVVIEVLQYHELPCVWIMDYEFVTYLDIQFSC